MCHSCLSMFIVSLHLINIQCPFPEPDFSCLYSGENLTSPILCVFGGAYMFVISYFIDSIYNFQFISIRGDTGILSNYKPFTIFPLLMKYVSMGMYLSPNSNGVTAIYFIIIASINLIQLYLKFNYSFNFSRLISEVDVIGQAITAYNFLLCSLVNVLNYKITNGDFFLAILLNFVIGYIVYSVRKSNWNSKLYGNLKNIKNL